MQKRHLLLILLMALAFVPLAMNGQSPLTVCNGTEKNSAIPLNAYSTDTQGSCGEFIIPANQLTDMAGGTITQIQFYISDQGYAWTSNFKVYMKEVTGTTLSSTYGPDACTVVYNGALDGSTGTITIPCDDYVYNGGNLLIGTYITTAGNYDGQSNFYGIQATEAAYASGTWNNSNDGSYNFIPKTTFTFTPYTPTIIDADATIGTGTSTDGYAPIMGNYEGSYDQMIYTAAQLSDQGIENFI